MNIVEQLMSEHAALRLHFRFARELDSNTIYEVEDFVRNCHAKVEDEIVFPILTESIASTGNEDLRHVLSRLEADHKLIDRMGDQIRVRTAQRDMDALAKRVSLYMNAVESHNSNEESLIFQYWPHKNLEQRNSASKAREIIEEFGLYKYFIITGISEKLLDSVR